MISVVLGVGALVALLAGLATMDAFDSATLMYELVNGGPTSLVIPALVVAAGLALAAIITGHAARPQLDRDRWSLAGLVLGYVLLSGMLVIAGFALLLRALVDVFW